MLFLSVFGVLVKKYFQSKFEQSKTRIGDKFDEILLKKLLENSDVAELVEIRYDFGGGLVSATERLVLEHEVVVRNECGRGTVFGNETEDKLDEHIFNKNYRMVMEK